MSKPMHTVKASAWTIGGKLLGRTFDIALLIYLSRVLSPEDFGLVALAMAPIYIGEAILELPLVQTLLRFETPDTSMYDTAFTLSILRAFTLALIFVGLSWPLAKFYDDPRLISLICVLSLAPIFRGSFSPRMVIFMKKMDFRREFLLEVIGKGVSFVIAIIIATLTRSYWAIAAATIISPFTMNILSYTLAPYRPRFSLKAWPSFANMVGWLSVTQIISAINWQMDRLFLGRFVTTDSLGKYSFANELIALPYRSFVSPLGHPMMANFTSKHTMDDLAKSYISSSGVIFLLISPIFLTLSLLAEPIIVLFVGNKWIDAAPIVTWLAAFTILVLPAAPLTSLALTLDRTRLITLRVSIEFVSKLVIMSIGVFYYGIWGAVIAYGVATCVALITALCIARKLIDITIAEQLSVILRGGISLVLMGVVIWFSYPETVGSNPLKLLIGIIISAVLGGAVYFLSSYIIWRLLAKPNGAEKAILNFAREAF